MSGTPRTYLIFAGCDGAVGGADDYQTHETDYERAIALARETMSLNTWAHIATFHDNALRVVAQLRHNDPERHDLPATVYTYHCTYGWWEETLPEAIRMYEMCDNIKRIERWNGEGFEVFFRRDEKNEKGKM